MSMVAQRIHLEPEQKEALQRMAESSGRSMAAEIRQAIDHHLREQEPEEEEPELEELQVLAIEAEAAFDAMCSELDAAINKLSTVLAAIDRLRKAAP